MSMLAGSFSGFGGSLFYSFINQIRPWIKPLLALSPMAYLVASSKERESQALKKIEDKFCSSKSCAELAKHHRELKQEDAYRFIPAKNSGKKPLLIVSLGTRQNFDSNDSGLMKAVEHARKHHDTHILILKAPNAETTIKDLLNIHNDVRYNPTVKTQENIEVIKDVLEAEGDFKNIQVDGVALVGYSWGAGMLCDIRERGVFKNTKILCTAMIDGVKPGIEHGGASLVSLNGPEPNFNCHQTGDWFIQGAHPHQLGKEDIAICKSDKCHDNIDDDGETLGNICEFISKYLKNSQSYLHFPP